MLTVETISLMEAIDHLVDVRVAAAGKHQADQAAAAAGKAATGDEERIREARARLQIALTRVTDKIPWSGR